MNDDIFKIFVTLFFASAFLVPGFIMHRVVSCFVVQRAENVQLFVLRFLTYTLVLYAIVARTIFHLIRTHFYVRHPILTEYVAVFVLFGLPAMLGLAIGVYKQKVERLLITGFLDRFGVHVLDHEKSAWGYQFCRIMAGIDGHDIVMVTVKMKDGSQVAGLYGSKSHASEHSPEADIYIEKTLVPQTSGCYDIDASSLGILIKHEDILVIEFRMCDININDQENLHVERTQSTSTGETVGAGTADAASSHGQPPAGRVSKGIQRPRRGTKPGNRQASPATTEKG